MAAFELSRALIYIYIYIYIHIFERAISTEESHRPLAVILRHRLRAVQYEICGIIDT